jgi:ATP-dependent Zn protease
VQHRSGIFFCLRFLAPALCWCLAPSSSISAPLMISAARYISSDAMATLIDCEVQSMLHEGRATAYTVLSEHYDQLTKLAHTLMEHEQLDRAQFEAVLQE